MVNQGLVDRIYAYCRIGDTLNVDEHTFGCDSDRRNAEDRGVVIWRAAYLTPYGVAETRGESTDEATEDLGDQWMGDLVLGGLDAKAAALWAYKAQRAVGDGACAVP